jgi:putative SOS response-associated peptidase YedK
MYIRDRSGAPLAFAGLWAVWRDPEVPDAPWLRSCTVVTTDANAAIAPIHDRMPVMLARDAWDRWLDRELTDGEVVADLLRPAPDDLLELWPVSPRVNSPKHDDPTLLEAI